jgi:hypothetical protein
MTRSPSRTTRRVSTLAAGLAVFAASLVAEAIAQASCGMAPTISSARTTWERVGAPEFRTGPQYLTGYAVDTRLPDRVFATNGVAVARSLDGGCTWAETFAIPATPAPDRPYVAATTKVISLQLSEQGSVYLLLDDPVHPRVVFSGDAGATWQSIDNGIGPNAQQSMPPKLALSPTEGTVFVLTHPAPAVDGGPKVDVVYGTADNGSTWVGFPTTAGFALSLGNVADVPRFVDLAVGQPNVLASPATQILGTPLWAATDRGLFKSNNGGESWLPMAVGTPNRMGGIRLSGGGDKDEIAMYELGSARMYLSPDAGDSWNTVVAPEPVETVAFGRGGLNVFVSSFDGHVFQLDANTLAWTPVWDSSPGLRYVMTSATRDQDVYGCTCDGHADDAIWRRTAARIAPPPRLATLPKLPENGYDPCVPDGFKAPEEKEWGTPELRPDAGVVSLRPGTKRAVPVSLHLPPQQLDVYFIADMGPKSLFTYCPTKHGQAFAVAELMKTRNIRAGIGEFGDYPSGTNPQESLFVPLSGDFVYGRDRRIGLPDKRFFEAVQHQRNINQNGAPSGDGAALEATYQAVTGAGRLVDPVGGKRSPYDIAKGLVAGFDPRAVPVVVLMTGQRFSTLDRRPGYLGADFATTKLALRNSGATFLGIWMDNARNKEAGLEPSGHPDLVELAKASGAYSTKELDCQDDQYVDVHRGDPMVCDYVAPAEGQFASHDLTLGYEITRMLASLEHRAPVEVGPLYPNDPSVVDVTPRVYPSVELLRGADLDYGVTFRCGLAMAGRSRTVTLAARVGGKVVTTADVVVSCPIAPAPPPHLVAIAPPIPPLPVPNPIPHPQPGPGPAANPAPNPAPNPGQAPQAQAQPVANAMPVVQQEKEPQLAFAKASNELQELAGEHQMTAYRHRGPLPPGAAGSLVAMCLLSGMAYGSRMLATARGRRRP